MDNLSKHEAKQEDRDDGAGQTFEQLLDSLKNAVSEFQNESSPEKFAKIVTVLSAFGISGADIWNKTTDFTKKHPIQAALGAGLIFFAFKGLYAPMSKELANQDSMYH
jgi:hypothetical protein